MVRLTPSMGATSPVGGSQDSETLTDWDDEKYGKRGSSLPSFLQPYLVGLRRWLFTFRRLPIILQMGVSMLLVLIGIVLCHWTLTSAAPLETTSPKQGVRHSPSIRTNLGELSSVHSYTPRVIQLLDSPGLKASLLPTDDLPSKGEHKLEERYITLPHNQKKELKPASSLDKGKCQPTAQWQVGHHPNCNVVHESSQGFAEPLSPGSNARIDDSDDIREVAFVDPHEQLRYAAGGAFRWVFMIREFDGTRKALKTLRIDTKSKDFDLRNFDRHRRDAVAMDELTKSPLIVDLYGYCSNSALFDWGEGGDLEQIFEREPHISKDKLLNIAYNVSMSIHDAHNFDDRGRPTIAHTDIKIDQFLYQNGYYRLTDFNRVRFLMWNEDENKPCPFHVGKNGGNWRSPEEYNYEGEREKVDVYSLGNVLYYLLVREEPWEDYRSKEIYRRVGGGKRPKIPDKLLESKHPFDVYMIEAMQMAWTHDQKERPGALAVAEKLQEGIAKLGT